MGMCTVSRYQPLHCLLLVLYTWPDQAVLGGGVYGLEQGLGIGGCGHGVCVSDDLFVCYC